MIGTKSQRRALSLVVTALIVANCSERQQTPSDLQVQPEYSLYDFSKVPADLRDLPPQEPERVIAAASMLAPPIELVTNGSFTAGYSGWTTVNSGSGSWFLHGGGSVSGFAVPSPPSLPFAAMTQQSGPGSHILFQDVVLPAQLCGTPQLSFNLFIGNRAGIFYSPPTLSQSGGRNQQFRADIMSPSAPVADVGGGVLQNVYQTMPGNPAVEGYKLVSVPVTAAAGSTIRLRFAEVDNQSFFQAGVDNVSLQAQPDVAAPTISLAVSPSTLWPPNHAMVKVASGIAATDDCDNAPTVVVTVSSNEPTNGQGDGNTSADWQVVNNGDGTFDVLVRAERSGKGSGRIYTISVTATDNFGNSSTASGTVTVPHDKR